MIKLFNSKFNNRSISIIKKNFLSGDIYSGNQVKKFEVNLLKFFKKHKEVVALSDLSNAIFLLLKVCNIKKGDEILVASFNCLSSTTSIVNVGAKPVWVDLNKDYPEMSLSDCEKKVNKKTKALILYHVAGYPSETSKFKNFCKKNNLIFIEDINNSFGSKIDGFHVGTNSDYTILSFYPNRQLGSINGAAVVCSNNKIASKLKRLRKYGIDKNKFRNKNGEINENFDLKEIGYFFEMSDTSAAILNYRLKYFNKNLKRTKENVDLYKAKLKNTKLISKIDFYKNSRPNCWVYFIRSKNSQYILKKLKNKNIECSKLHYPNHLYRKMYNLNSRLENTTIFWKEVIALPCYPSTNKSNILKIINFLNSV
jgi:perosamine synthetase